MVQAIVREFHPVVDVQPGARPCRVFVHRLLGDAQSGGNGLARNGLGDHDYHLSLAFWDWDDVHERL